MENIPTCSASDEVKQLNRWPLPEMNWLSPGLTGEMLDDLNEILNEKGKRFDDFQN